MTTIALTQKRPAKVELIILPFSQQTDTPAYRKGIAADAGIQLGQSGRPLAREFKELVFDQANGQLYASLGLGDAIHYGSITKAFRFLVNQLSKMRFASCTVYWSDLLASIPGMDPELAFEAMIKGLHWGDYKGNLYKTTPPSLTTPRFTILSSLPQATVRQRYKQSIHVTEVHRKIMDLVNTPSNYKVPDTLAKYAQASGQSHGFTTRILKRTQLGKLGLNALLAVGQGSQADPCLIIMEYRPKVRSPKKVCMVGKGVTFDTGGISIKSSQNMHYMKSDMGGAAAVLGAMELASRWRLPIHLTGIIPAAENAVDAHSVKPGDVVKACNGKTIEIIDTDAEGRLILADALAYAQKHYPSDYLIDLATLTGSCVATFGYQCSGMFTQNPVLSKSLQTAGDEVQERTWPLPLWKEYEEDLKSDIADVRNFHGKPMAGAIMGAKFLEYFTGKHPAWAHLDIAGVAFSDNEYSTLNMATGYGVRLLTRFLENLGK